MRRYLWLAAGMVAFAACSNREDRRASISRDDSLLADLTLPDTVMHQDTAAAHVRADPPVSTEEQQVASRESTPSAPKKRTAKRSRPRAQVAARPESDTSVRAYAPIPPSDTNRVDTAEVSRSDTTTADTSTTPADMAASASPDTAAQVATAATDSVRPPRDTAVALPDNVARVDSLRAAAESVPPPIRDTAPTAPLPGTTSTAVPDTMVAPTPAPARDVAARTLAVGTEIHAALNDSITSRRDTVGKQVSAHVMENVVGPDGRTLIAAGTPVRLTIARLRPARSKGSQGRLALRPDGIALDGQLRPVKADLKPVPRELRGRGVTGSEVAKVGGGAAAGAVLGRVIGGNTKGAVIGGVAGAAAGAAVATQTATRDVVVKAKTPLVLVLTAPLVVP